MDPDRMPIADLIDADRSCLLTAAGLVEDATSELARLNSDLPLTVAAAEFAESALAVELEPNDRNEASKFERRLAKLKAALGIR